MTDALKRLEKKDRELMLLEHISALLQWDYETKMPPKGLSERSQQIVLLDSLIHKKLADPELGKILDDLGAGESSPGGSADLDPVQQGMVRSYFRENRKSRLLPSSWVEEFSEVTSQAHPAWVQARKEGRFSDFRPWLEKIVRLCREKTELFGYQDHPYDPLLDEYEPGMTTAAVDRVFSQLRRELPPLAGEIIEAGRPDDSFLFQDYEKEKLEAFGTEILQDMGYDFQRGRMDESVHPFTTAVGQHDVRLTTRYTEPSAADALFSIIHEGGHGLYEQEARAGDAAGTRNGSGASQAMHESQARLWENMVGKSRAFWEHYYPRFQDLFPRQTAAVSLDEFLRGITKVAPSCIRVNADEVTYSLHVVLRFTLEKALITGDLVPADLPGAWNEQMELLVGITPPNDAQGVLQDMHWAAGMIGYFPTYALGNLYSAQLYECALADIPGMDASFRRGNFSLLRGWFNAQVYRHGASRQAPEILETASGKPLDASCFIRYLRQKYRDLLEA